MMTREQREAAYAAVGILRRQVSDRYADAVSQALADVHEYEAAKPSPLVFPAVSDDSERLIEKLEYAIDEMRVWPRWLNHVMTLRDAIARIGILEAREQASTTACLAVGADGPVLRAEPEVYTYWVGASYVKEGMSYQGGVEVRRSTPILTREDILAQADLIKADQGWSHCSILGIFPIVDEG